MSRVLHSHHVNSSGDIHSDDDSVSLNLLQPQSSGAQPELSSEKPVRRTTGESIESLRENTNQLSQIRSRSVEIPREKPIEQLKDRGGFRAHFVHEVPHGHQQTEARTRPGISGRSYSFNPPSIRRLSISRSVSSFSLYSKFAGERFDVPRPRTKSNDNIDIEKRSKTKKAEIANGGIEENSVEHSEETEDQPDQPKASVGKAMFMFLKAFIGSGVLFLPKA
ncbi:hypothetical protein DFQ28_009609 [Apophysomyces sp. BC1034]|nr:hypothetical protein DFQ30_006547 [Apophysomyces sp. BC1015]KAG0181047.1 hypothetical protein DFQ29_009514 [Apophysomyces sp. BC1021]KAG0192288.1 hypothetical protein DFQ28_009609 [Apophysomyces sp. BC1034]